MRDENLTKKPKHSSITKHNYTNLTNIYHRLTPCMICLHLETICTQHARAHIGVWFQICFAAVRANQTHLCGFKYRGGTDKLARAGFDNAWWRSALSSQTSKATHFYSELGMFPIDMNAEHASAMCTEPHLGTGSAKLTRSHSTSDQGLGAVRNQHQQRKQEERWNSDTLRGQTAI